MKSLHERRGEIHIFWLTGIPANKCPERIRWGGRNQLKPDEALRRSPDMSPRRRPPSEPRCLAPSLKRCAMLRVCCNSQCGSLCERLPFKRFHSSDSGFCGPCIKVRASQYQRHLSGQSWLQSFSSKAYCLMRLSCTKVVRRPRPGRGSNTLKIVYAATHTYGICY